jgi:hypothetical protein
MGHKSKKRKPVRTISKEVKLDVSRDGMRGCWSFRRVKSQVLWQV